MGKKRTLNYRQIALKLISKIRNGQYKPGKKIDSIRDIAAEYGVSRQVAVSAINLLARENFVYSLHGSGTFVNPNQAPGLFHRIAYFVKDMNPAFAYSSISYAVEVSFRHGFSLIIGSDFEEEFTFRQWLEKRNNFDGVIMSGDVDESDLNYLARHRIPYVLCGNYDVGDEHPQAAIELTQIIYDCFVDFFRQHSWRKVAILGGMPDNRADRETVQGIINAMQSVGMEYAPERILWDNVDGLEILEEYFAREVPDAIVMLGKFWRGLNKYCDLHPDFKPPETIILNQHAGVLRVAKYDHHLHIPDEVNLQIVEKCMTSLLRQMAERRQGSGVPIDTNLIISNNAAK